MLQRVSSCGKTVVGVRCREEWTYMLRGRKRGRRGRGGCIAREAAVGSSLSLGYKIDVQYMWV